MSNVYTYPSMKVVMIVAWHKMFI